MSPSSSRGNSRDRSFPDQSKTDWGRADAIRARSTTGRTYDYDGYSDMEIGADGTRADGGLLSAEELPPGRVCVWE